MNAGIGFATRQKLRDANHAAPHQSDDTYGFSTGRARDKLMGYGEQDDFALPRRPFMPNFNSLGTPGEIRRSRADRLEGAYSTMFWISVALILSITALWWIKAPAANQPRPADISLEYRTKAARLLPGEALYFTNSQGCFVYMHKEIVSPLVISLVSDHC